MIRCEKGDVHFRAAVFEKQVHVRKCYPGHTCGCNADWEQSARDREIKDLVRKGYVIRTRADSDTREARLNDKSSFKAACESGAQIITSIDSILNKSPCIITFTFQMSCHFVASSQMIAMFSHLSKSEDIHELAPESSIHLCHNLMQNERSKIGKKPYEL